MSSKNIVFERVLMDFYIGIRRGKMGTMEGKRGLIGLGKGLGIIEGNESMQGDRGMDQFFGFLRYLIFMIENGV